MKSASTEAINIHWANIDGSVATEEILLNPRLWISWVYPRALSVWLVLKINAGYSRFRVQQAN